VSAPVFVIGPDQLRESSVVLDGAEARHAATVRRMRVGEPIVVTDGQGRAAVGVVSAVSRDRVVVGVERRLERPAPKPRLVVVQAIPKGERADRAVELMTEVGVDEIVPFTAQRCVARWSADRVDSSLARWRTTAREAAKQSRRWWFPEVGRPVGLDALAERVATSALALVLHEAGEGSAGSVSAASVSAASVSAASVSIGSVPVPNSGDVLLVVGPEGGLTDDEVDRLVVAGATVARLGPTVLRTSTAGAAAAVSILSRTPRWDVGAVGSAEEE